MALRAAVAEDHAGATIRPRAEALAANLDRIHVVEVRRDGIEDTVALPDDTDELDRLASERRARLVVIDPLTAHLPEAVNSWRDQSVRRTLAPLHRLAARQGCAVLVVAHLNKAHGADPLYRAGGSIGIPAAVRSALLLARDPNDPDAERGVQRVLAHVKCNVSVQAESLACHIDPVQLTGDVVAPRLTVTGASGTAAADLLVAPTAEERTERDEAADFLRAELAGGPLPARAVKRAASEAGISERTLRRAKVSLAVKAARVSHGNGGAGAWLWALPGQGGQMQGVRSYIPDGAPLLEGPLASHPHASEAPKEATGGDIAPTAIHDGNRRDDCAAPGSESVRPASPETPIGQVGK